MADDPQLVVAITARLDQFEKQMKEAGLIAERGVKAMESQLSTFTLGTAFGTLLSKVITAALDEIQKAIVDTFNIMLKLDEAARKTGLSFEALQRVGGAALAGGLSQGEALNGLNKMAATMEEMNRSTTTLSKYLDANNVKFRDQAGHVVNVDKGLELAATLMARAASESEKIKIAQLFGLTEQWVRVLGDGAESFRKMKDSMPVKDLEQSVRHAQALQVLANRISAEFARWGTDLIVGVLPALQSIAAWFTAISTGLAGIAKGGPLETFTTDLEKKWGKLAGFIQETIDTLNRPKITVTGPGTNFPTARETNALVSAEDALKRRTALLQEEARTVAMTTAQQEQARAVTELLTAAERAQIPVTSELRAQFEQLGATYGAAAQQARVAQAQFAEINASSREMGQLLADAFKAATLEGKKLDEVLKNLVNRLASRSIDKLFDMFFAPTPGIGGSSAFTNLLKGLQGRASGGPVSAGTPYMVGERGAELFVPNRSGMIVPNSATRGGAGAMTFAPVNNIDARGSTMGEAQFKAILAANNRQMLQAVNQAAPARQRRLAMLGT